MAGIIGSDWDLTKTKLAPDANTLTQAGVVGVDPNLRTVNADTETVSGQLKALLNTDSPYIQQARTSAAQYANSRGLINSSIGAGAGESAAIAAGLPIASADASIYGNVSAANQGFQNQALTNEAQATNTAGIVNAGTANEFAKTKLAGEQELGRIAAAGTETRATQATGATLQQAQSRLEGEIKAGLITTEEQANARLAELQGEIQKGTIAATGEQQRTTLAQTGTQDVALQTLRGTQATGLSQIEAQYKQMIQSSASASDLFKTTSAALTAIMADVNTSSEQKTTAVNAMTQMLHAGMAVVGSIANLDLVSLLDFGTTP